MDRESTNGGFRGPALQSLLNSPQVTPEERVKQRFRYLKALYDRVGDDIAVGS
jgi:hypothetical protein